MNGCAFCGRVNEASSRFCIDCGKPLTPSAARVVNAAAAQYPTPSAPPAPASSASPAATSLPARRAPAPPVPAPSAARSSPAARAASCARCEKGVDPALPFCAHCGWSTGEAGSRASCGSCGAAVQPGIDLFCSRCGARFEGTSVQDAGTVVLSVRPRESVPMLSLLDESGAIVRSYELGRGELSVGRSDGDIRFSEDVYLSPLHAQFSMRDGQLWVRDLGSRNRSWVFLDGPCRLNDGDVLLVGSQMLRFRRLGYPGPHPPEADATRRMGSLTPTADVAVLAQLRADGSVRDTFHLSPGRNVSLGRESGDWVFPYDQTMSGRHAEVRSEDSEFVVHDADSRNGVAIAVRGERAVRRGQRVLLGDQLLRVESV